MESYEKNISPNSSFFTYSPSVNVKEGLLYLCSTGNFTYEPGYDLKRDNFDSFLLEIVLDGSMVFETGGKSFMAKRDDVVLLDCYKPHRYYTATGCHALWLHFDGAPARAYYNLIQKTHGNVFPARSVHKILRCVEEIYNIMSSNSVPNEPSVALTLTTALTAMAESDSPAKFVRSNASAIEKVIHYINAHIDEELSIAELAHMASFSEFHFIRLFSDVVGMTPRKYIINVRMDYAKYLLKTTALPIAEIVFRIGYASESMFCASFKKHTGVTPSEYRSDVIIAQHRKTE